MAPEPATAQLLPIAPAVALLAGRLLGRLAVSFYAFFTTIPRGKHIIRVCLGTACYVKGSKQILDNLEKALDVKVGGITKDRTFSLEAVRCLGCCSLAPAIVIDNDTHALVDPAEAIRIVRSYG